MRPDWDSDDEGEGGGSPPERPHASGHLLPIISPDDDEGEDPEADDELDLEVDSEPRVVLITGASGNIGRKLRAAWEDVYDLVLIDSNPGPDEEDVIKADLSILDDEWGTHFHGVDTVVHLAANPDPESSAADLVEPNLDAMANVFNVAAMLGVDRIIYASSVHVMWGYREKGDGPITPDLPPRPESPYGLFKLAGERLGQSLADAFDLTFIAVRLGHVQAGRNRPEALSDDWHRKLWLSNHDLVQLFDAAVEAEIEDDPFVVVNGISRNHGTRWTLTNAAEVLGYLPEDDAFAPHPNVEAVDEVS
ncbi:dTDP-4-dehydro-6-deoxyglucose reductase [Aquisphaera giovannonii]|uniref:dTDP-4-dehydro-6-deoxyglucose reductase n=1 Tax=Aquisphaera giovannonii TaxID=406548 RepID=A0A5B9W0M9_9BACT|nr:NAD(P)-dependent oxidoreductase [Aquisphaera giovannonii]QEH34202.1 dTDP-4-dehydro-6-deoxyglucose reductase [Aquisphaera giovannonii]